MQANIRALIAINMHFDFGPGVQAPAVRQLIPLNVGPDHVIAGADRNSLGKFAGVVRIDFPANFLFIGPTDLDLNRVEGVAVRVPDRSNNQRVGLWLGLHIGSPQTGEMQNQQE